VLSRFIKLFPFSIFSLNKLFSIFNEELPLIIIKLSPSFIIFVKFVFVNVYVQEEEEELLRSIKLPLSLLIILNDELSKVRQPEPDLRIMKPSELHVISLNVVFSKLNETEAELFMKYPFVIVISSNVEFLMFNNVKEIVLIKILLFIVMLLNVELVKLTVCEGLFTLIKSPPLISTFLNDDLFK
jgi:hypothetical protein